MFNNIIFGYHKLSLCDWPDRPSAVIFIGGCNFNCPTCHNKIIVNKETESIPFGKVYKDIEKSKKWLSGLVITGGEPLYNKNISLLIDSFRQLSLPIKVDTNGSNPYLIQELLPLVNLFAIDVKGLWDKYNQLTGGKINEYEVRYCFKVIFKMAKEFPDKFYFRTTLVPGLTTEDIEVVRSYLPKNQILHLQTYRPHT